MSTTSLPSWAKDLSPEQQQQLMDVMPEADFLADEIQRCPNFLALVMELICPGHGDTLARVMRRKPYLLQLLRAQL